MVRVRTWDILECMQRISLSPNRRCQVRWCRQISVPLCHCRELVEAPFKAGLLQVYQDLRVDRIAALK